MSMETSRNHTPHGYEWRFHGKPGQPGARWVLCRKRSLERQGRIATQEAQRAAGLAYRTDTSKQQASS